MVLKTEAHNNIFMPDWQQVSFELKYKWTKGIPIDGCPHKLNTLKNNRLYVGVKAIISVSELICNLLQKLKSALPRLNPLAPPPSMGEGVTAYRFGIPFCVILTNILFFVNILIYNTGCIFFLSGFWQPW